MKYFLITFYLFLSAQLRAHDFYFAFAELQYNEETKTFQGTLSFTGHDVEDALLRVNFIKKGLAYIEKNDTTIHALERYLLKNFRLKYKLQNIPLHILDYEIQKNGLLYIYIESDKIELEKREIEIAFCNLMDVFSEQQNKITFVAEDKKITEVFLPGSCIKLISW